MFRLKYLLLLILITVSVFGYTQSVGSTIGNPKIINFVNNQYIDDINSINYSVTGGSGKVYYKFALPSNVTHLHIRTCYSTTSINTRLYIIDSLYGETNKLFENRSYVPNRYPGNHSNPFGNCGSSRQNMLITNDNIYGEYNNNGAVDSTYKYKNIFNNNGHKYYIVLDLEDNSTNYGNVTISVQYTTNLQSSHGDVAAFPILLTDYNLADFNHSFYQNLLQNDYFTSYYDGETSQFVAYKDIWYKYEITDNFNGLLLKSNTNFQSYKINAYKSGSMEPINNHVISNAIINNTYPGGNYSNITPLTTGESILIQLYIDQLLPNTDTTKIKMNIKKMDYVSLAMGDIIENPIIVNNYPFNASFNHKRYNDFSDIYNSSINNDNKDVFLKLILEPHEYYQFSTCNNVNTHSLYFLDKNYEIIPSTIINTLSFFCDQTAYGYYNFKDTKDTIYIDFEIESNYPNDTSTTINITQLSKQNMYNGIVSNATVVNSSSKFTDTLYKYNYDGYIPTQPQNVGYASKYFKIKMPLDKDYLKASFQLYTPNSIQYNGFIVNFYDSTFTEITDQLNRIAGNSVMYDIPYQNFARASKLRQGATYYVKVTSKYPNTNNYVLHSKFDIIKSDISNITSITSGTFASPISITGNDFTHTQSTDLYNNQLNDANSKYYTDATASIYSNAYDKDVVYKMIIPPGTQSVDISSYGIVRVAVVIDSMAQSYRYQILGMSDKVNHEFLFDTLASNDYINNNIKGGFRMYNLKQGHTYYVIVESQSSYQNQVYQLKVKFNKVSPTVSKGDYHFNPFMINHFPFNSFIDFSNYSDNYYSSEGLYEKQYGGINSSNTTYSYNAVIKNREVLAKDVVYRLRIPTTSTIDSVSININNYSFPVSADYPGFPKIKLVDSISFNILKSNLNVGTYFGGQTFLGVGFPLSIKRSQLTNNQTYFLIIEKGNNLPLEENKINFIVKAYDSSKNEITITSTNLGETTSNPIPYFLGIKDVYNNNFNNFESDFNNTQATGDPDIFFKFTAGNDQVRVNFQSNFIKENEYVKFYLLYSGSILWSQTIRAGQSVNLPTLTNGIEYQLVAEGNLSSNFKLSILPSYINDNEGFLEYFSPTCEISYPLTISSDLISNPATDSLTYWYKKAHTTTGYVLLSPLNNAKNIILSPADTGKYICKVIHKGNRIFEDTLVVNFPSTMSGAKPILLLTPANQSPFINNIITPTFLSWESDPNAAYYDLYIWKSGTSAPNTPTATQLIQNHFLINENDNLLESNNQYLWYVRSYNKFKKCIQYTTPTFNFSTTPKFDVQVSTIVSAPIVESGRYMDITWTVKNNSTLIGTQLQTWIDKVYISLDPAGINELYTIGYFNNSKLLNSLESYTQTKSIFIPLKYFTYQPVHPKLNLMWLSDGISISDFVGQFYINVRSMDNKPDYKFYNSDDNIANNIFTKPIIIRYKPYSDIKILNANVTPRIVYNGDSIIINYLVKNIGNLALSNISTGSLFQDKIMLDTSYISCGHHNPIITTYNAGLYNLAPDSTINIKYKYYLPYYIKSGKYFANIELNHLQTIYEGPSYNNNCITSDTITVLERQGANLNAKTITSSNLNLYPTAQATVTYVVENKSTAEINLYHERHWSDNIYLVPSTFSGIPTYENLVGSKQYDLISINAISQQLFQTNFKSNAYYTGNIAINIPKNIVPGYYKLILKTDGQDNIFENGFESDNFITLSGININVENGNFPDLTLKSSADTIFTDNPSKPNKVVISNIGNNTGNILFELFSQINYTYNGINQIYIPSYSTGTNTLNPGDSLIFEEYYLSNNPNIVRDTILNGLLTINITSYDNNFYDKNTTNNTLVKPIKAKIKGYVDINANIKSPDLAVDFTTPSLAYSGEEINLKIRISNIKSFSGVHLGIGNISLFDSLTGNLLEILYPKNDSLHYNKTLNAFASDTFNIKYKIPHLINGKFRLQINTPVIRNELNGDNNIASKFVNVIGSNYPDLAVKIITISSQNLAINDSVLIRFSIKNIGQAPVSANNLLAKISIFPSTDLLFYSGITLKDFLVSLTGNTLMHGDSLIWQEKVKVERAFENSINYIYVRVDPNKLLNDKNLLNNYANLPVYINPEVANVDFIITSITSQAIGKLGYPFNGSITIKNIGIQDFLGSTNVPFYLMKNTTLSGDDYEVVNNNIFNNFGNNAYPLSISANSQVTLSFSGLLNTINQGQYYSGSYINSSNNIKEINANNNIYVTTTNINIDIDELSPNVPVTKIVTYLNRDNTGLANTYYKINGVSGKDMLIELRTNSGKYNNSGEIFVRKGQTPTRLHYDIKFSNNKYDTIQYVLVPNVDNNPYYIFIRSPYNAANELDTLTTKVQFKDFGILKAEPTKLGDSYVTTKIYGFVLTNIKKVELIDPVTGNIASVGIVVQELNSTFIRVRWNLNNVPFKKYHLKITKNSGETSTLNDAVTVEKGYIEIIKEPVIDEFIRYDRTTNSGQSSVNINAKATFPIGAIITNRSNVDIPNYTFQLDMYKPLKINTLEFNCSDCYNVIKLSNFTDNKIGKLMNNKNILAQEGYPNYDTLKVKDYFDEPGIISVPLMVRYFEPGQEVNINANVTAGPYPADIDEFGFNLHDNIKSRGQFVSFMFYQAELVRNFYRLLHKAEDISDYIQNPNLLSNRKLFMDSTIYYLLQKGILQKYDTIGLRDSIYNSKLVKLGDTTNLSQFPEATIDLSSPKLKLKGGDTLIAGPQYYDNDFEAIDVSDISDDAPLYIHVAGDLSQTNLYTEGITLLQSSKPISNISNAVLDLAYAIVPYDEGQNWTLDVVPPQNENTPNNPQTPKGKYRVILKKTKDFNPKVKDIDFLKFFPFKFKWYPYDSPLFGLAFGYSDPSVNNPQSNNFRKPVPCPTIRIRPRRRGAGGGGNDECDGTSFGPYASMANDLRKIEKAGRDNKPGKIISSTISLMNRLIPKTDNCGLEAVRQIVVDGASIAANAAYPSSDPTKKFNAVKDASISAFQNSTKTTLCVIQQACDAGFGSDDYCSNVSEAKDLLNTLNDALTCVKGSDAFDVAVNLTNCVEKLIPDACRLQRRYSPSHRPQSRPNSPNLNTRKYASPCDPNEIVGPLGVGVERYVKPTDDLTYKVSFENDSLRANVAARKVYITVKFPSNIDPFSLEGISFGFGNFNYQLQSASNKYTLQVSPNGKSYNVQYTHGYNLEKSELFWLFDTYDVNGFIPSDPTVGFLPPNNANHDGEGYVKFKIRPHNNINNLDSVAFTASIYFDNELPVVTNTWKNKFLISNPNSSVTSIIKVDTGKLDINVDYGNDVASVDLYLSLNNGIYSKIADNFDVNQLPITVPVFTNYANYEYCFVSSANDIFEVSQPFDSTHKKCYKHIVNSHNTLTGIPTSKVTALGAYYRLTVSGSGMWSLSLPSAMGIASPTSGTGSGFINLTVLPNLSNILDRDISLAFTSGNTTNVITISQFGYLPSYFSPSVLTVGHESGSTTITLTGSNIYTVSVSSALNISTLSSLTGIQVLSVSYPENINQTAINHTLTSHNLAGSAAVFILHQMGTS
ncbi:MAG: hypothetical protein NW207_13040, partial [Cytophagales bacterium]|nr:hypothetical protein [Cytophagales bacterium]